MLEPAINSVVCRKTDLGRDNPGIVQRLGDPGSDLVGVRWKNCPTIEFVGMAQLTSGLHVNMEVEHKSRSILQPGLGWGVVRGYRLIGGQGQNLVEFPELDQRLWLPWQRLAMIRGVKNRVMTGRFGQGDDPDRQRLRILARAIELWNENTGALSTFDVDPLPHQIQLVHHILGSENRNWLIADDVGLGKTIEVGLLLSALRQRGQAERVLLITPAGLTRQWKEEFEGKFGLNGFRIFGDQFTIEEPREWAMHKEVIASMDKLRADEHLERLLLGDSWDLIVVDEAHRLSRSDEGHWQNETLRYRMARMLRSKTHAMILLTATPHQGKTDRFTALLELLYPERRRQFRRLEIEPEMLSEMVFRNRKADVTDMDGMPLFKGKETHRLEVPSSAAARDFDLALRRYLKRGYDAESRAGGAAGRAIGFVMTVYRKLAASSVAAIHTALEGRLGRLTTRIDERSDSVGNEDDRYQGEAEEARVYQYRERFFDDEIEMLQELVSQAAELLSADPKRAAFLGDFLPGMLSRNPNEKLLIFTEYKATQRWLAEGLANLFGGGKVGLINGDVKLEDRREVIRGFDDPDGLQFLVSTEAGGEGINLHRNCHVMVNYDLPWNPMRLVQRVGRLYRYGQTETVLVFNLHQADTADENILDKMYVRLDQVARDLCAIDEQEFNEALKDDVVGEISDFLDVEDILAQSDKRGRTWAESEIQQALDRARKAARLQDAMFRHASGFNPDELRTAVQVDASHIKALVEGLAEHAGYDILERTHAGAVWEVRLGEALANHFGLTRRRWRLCFDRELAASRSELHHMNMDSWLLQFLVRHVASPHFKGLASVMPQLPCDGMVAGIARWIGPRGQRLKQQLAVLASKNGEIEMNPEWLSDWLKQQLEPEKVEISDSDHPKKIFDLAEKQMDELMAAESGESKLPDSPQWISAAFIDK